MDIVPALFPKVRILRHPGYNVATWNVLERPIERTGNPSPYQAGGESLAIFHFSGFDPHGGGELSFNLPEALTRKKCSPALKKLIDTYSNDLQANGYDQCRTWGGAFDRFDNGREIPRLWPIYYHDVLRFRMKKGHNPYKGLPCSPMLVLLRTLSCESRHLRDRPYYFGWLSLLQKLGYVPKMLWGPPGEE